MPTIPIIGKSDRDDLSEMLRWWRSQSQNKRLFYQRNQDQSPEVYIARTPAEGIPALASDVGTGTGDVAGDEPGMAECLIYEIGEDSSAFTGTGSDNTSVAGMRLVSGLTQTVYNLSTNELSGGEWVVVARDKFGRWIVTGPNSDGAGGGGSTGDFIVDHVHVVESIADTGTGTAGLATWYCERVTLPGPSAWPPVADSSVQYLDVVESENRTPRLMDASGTATHIIPLFEDRNGNRYIVFWKTDTSAEITVPTAFTITQDPATCTITATPVLGTYTIYLEVAPTTDPRTGLRLRIE